MLGDAVASSAPAPLAIRNIVASSEQLDFPAQAAADGDRFSVQRGRLWKGQPDADAWTWTADLGEGAVVGSILQIAGDEESHVTSAPMNYVWQSSEEGATWHDIESTHVADERRMYRIHRLPKPAKTRYMRLSVRASGEQPPALREVEFYGEPDAKISFPEWLLVVSSHDKPSLATCHRYLDLARRCDGWEAVTAQFLWHGYLDPEFAAVEPRPLCLLFGGSSLEWCQVDREAWKGVERLLDEAKFPMWAACGGGQVFGLLEETGADAPWDCPNCRDPLHPKSPIYGHIGKLDPAKPTHCSVYTNNIYELGPTPVKLVKHDAVFEGLPTDFMIPEYHCGQLEHLPSGWDLLVTKGDGGKTWMQCMKKQGTCIYGAQFHIEHQGTPEASRQIMSNFLTAARQWQAGHAADNAAATSVTSNLDGVEDAVAEAPK